MTVSTFPEPPTDLEDQRRFNRIQSQSISAVLKGRTNNVIDFTATVSAASTTVTDSRIGVNTVAIAIPTTANAASAAVFPYRDFSSPVNGSMSLIHTNSGHTDNTYKIILVG
jgi:hypothetical protein